MEESALSPFRPCALVLVTLSSPREKFWGALLSLTAAGVSLRGVNLESFDDFAAQLRDGEPADAASVFFPMHRVERIEVDARSGEAPSLAERFETRTGRVASEVLALEVRE